MARASGLALAGGAEGNDPLRRLDDRHRRADRPGARAGRPPDHRRPRRVGDDRRRARRASRRCAARPACAPSSCRSPATCARRFVDAAAVFAPQKGATPAQVALLTARLEQLAQRYRDEYGVDVARARRRRRGGRAGRRAGRARRPARRPGSTSSPSTSTSTSGSPPPTSSSPARATSTRRASTARSSAACASWPPAAGRPVVVIVGDADPDVAAELDAPPASTVVSLVERYGERPRPFDRAALVHRARRRRRARRLISA